MLSKNLGFFLTAMLLASCATVANDQRAIPANPAIDAIAEAAVEQGFPGVVVAMSDRNGNVYQTAAGFADRKNNVLMHRHSRIHAASTTKTFTAAAILMLIDDGILSLDTLLPDVLPENVLTLVPNSDRMRVRDLLQHTSGIYSPNNDLKYVARYIGPDRLTKPFWTDIEIVAFAADPNNAPLFEPGDGKGYGDINYVLLGMIVGEISGRDLKTFVREEIFLPLNMNDSYYLSDNQNGERAIGYTLDSELIRVVGLDETLLSDADGLIDTTTAQEQSDGAAGIITTAPDLNRFADALLRKDLVSEKARDLLLSVANEAERDGNALGILRGYKKPYGLIIAAEGDGPGTNVVWAFNLQTNTIAVVATNLFGRFDENDYILDEMLPQLFSTGLTYQEQ